MNPNSLLLCIVLAGTTSFAQAPNPFIGTWVLNSDKTPNPTITYAIKDLGSGRFALTGSSGETTEVKGTESCSRWRRLKAQSAPSSEYFPTNFPMRKAKFED
jgi:hypothetical protein